MPITLLDFIRSGGDFALMGANDIEMANGQRLEAFLTAQLKSLGEADAATAEAMEALAERLTAADAAFEAADKAFEAADKALQAADAAFAATDTELANRTTAAEDRLDTLETPAESVDLTDFESDGTIIERRPDGSTVEQHMEFDENKVPIKIRHIVKNSDGEVLEENETSLIGFSEAGGGGGSGGIPPAYEERLSGLETEVDGIQDSIEEMQSVAEGALGALAGVQEDIDELQQAAAPAKNVDLSKFESEGKIEQTAADGVTKLTYKFTFDAEGNPTKIVNPDGSETTLTW